MLRASRWWWLVLAALLYFPLSQFDVSQHDVQNGLPSITLAELPNEARTTLRDIKRGGPYRYQRDDQVFNNYERLLPAQSRGYYHEYTVTTPGVKTRGARRIVSGAGDEYYYTADHYQTFKRIRESP